MNFTAVSSSLPDYGKQVIVRTYEGFYFTATFERDEEGEYWMTDLPHYIIPSSVEVINDIKAWSYLDG